MKNDKEVKYNSPWNIAVNFDIYMSFSIDEMETMLKEYKIAEKNTLFDDLIKNLNNYNNLKEYLFNLIINGEERTFNIHNETIDLGVTFGYLRNDHEKGLKQLAKYLENQSLNKGYLLIYNFNKNKEYKREEVVIEGKKIFVVWV